MNRHEHILVGCFEALAWAILLGVSLRLLVRKDELFGKML